MTDSVRLSSDAPLMQLAQIDPASGVDADYLGLAPHAFLLASLLSGLDEFNGQIIGVEGSWGIGKTSLVNLAREIIDPESWDKVKTKDLDEWARVFAPHPDLHKKTLYELKDIRRRSESVSGGGTIFVRPEVWAVSGVSALALLLIDALDQALPYDSKTQKYAADASRTARKHAGALLQLGGAAFGLFTALRLNDSVDAGGLASGLTPGSQGPAAARERLQEVLNARSKGRRIVLVIDDVDRLLPERIADLIQAVWFVRGLQNVVVVLVYDEARLLENIDIGLLSGGRLSSDEGEANERMHDAAQGTGTREASRFLEKIVQYVVRVPPPRASDLLEHFVHRITGGRRSIWDTSIAAPDGTTRSEMAEDILAAWLTTPRAVGRLAGAIEIARLWLPEDAYDVRDLAVVTALRLFDLKSFHDLVGLAWKLEDDAAPLVEKDKHPAIRFLLPAHCRQIGQEMADKAPISAESVAGRNGFGHRLFYRTYLTGALPPELELLRDRDTFVNREDATNADRWGEFQNRYRHDPKAQRRFKRFLRTLRDDEHAAEDRRKFDELFPGPKNSK